MFPMDLDEIPSCCPIKGFPGHVWFPFSFKFATGICPRWRWTRAETSSMIKFWCCKWLFYLDCFSLSHRNSPWSINYKLVGSPALHRACQQVLFKRILLKDAQMIGWALVAQSGNPLLYIVNIHEYTWMLSYVYSMWLWFHRGFYDFRFLKLWLCLCCSLHHITALSSGSLVSQWYLYSPTMSYIWLRRI